MVIFLSSVRRREFNESTYSISMDGDGEPRKDCRGNERKEGESWSLGSSGAGCPIAMEWNVSAAWNGNGNGKGRLCCNLCDATDALCDPTLTERRMA